MVEITLTEAQAIAILNVLAKREPDDFDPDEESLDYLVGEFLKKLEANDWDKPEDCSPLNIKSPPDWGDYDKYLLSGGRLEYPEWKSKHEAKYQSQQAIASKVTLPGSEQEVYERMWSDENDE